MDRVLTPSNILLFPYIELKTSTIGYPSCHTEVKIIDENGQVVPVGVPGELCIRGYANMLGYWNDKEKVKEVTQKKSKEIAEFISTNFPNFDYLVIVYQGHLQNDEYRGCVKCPDIIINE